MSEREYVIKLGDKYLCEGGINGSWVRTLRHAQRFPTFLKAANHLCSPFGRQDDREYRIRPVKKRIPMPSVTLAPDYRVGTFRVLINGNAILTEAPYESAKLHVRNLCMALGVAIPERCRG